MGKCKLSISGNSFNIIHISKCFIFRIESILRHFNTFIVSNEEDCLKALASPFLRDFQFLEDGSIVVQHFKEQVTMSRPNIIGISILELSKCLTYGYYYDVLRKAFGDRVRLAYTGLFFFSFWYWAESKLLSHRHGLLRGITVHRQSGQGAGSDKDHVGHLELPAHLPPVHLGTPETIVFLEERISFTNPSLCRPAIKVLRLPYSRELKRFNWEGKSSKIVTIATPS